MGALVRFGVFELDLRSRELCKRGMRLHLPDQSFEILVMLVKRPGDVITREEIREHLWPHGTVVEFEHSVNSAVNRLRVCLGDSATNPQFVETLPRRGYRFVAPVETEGDSPSSPHFRILGELGRGGMGVVYKADDLILGRTVALKFLPEELARHMPSLERFRREARTLAMLNHPGICTLHGIEEHEGRLCLVMEYLEGQPLSKLIETGPFDLRRALEIASHASEALAAAHSVGIVHHDITPSNIFVTGEGQIKILDFGLAEAARRQAPKDDASARKPATAISDPAAIEGTTAYMSPEQVQGEAIDARADVYSLGVVLYEMLCGKSPFGADSNLSELTSITHDQPPAPRMLRPDIPERVEQVVLRCLEKRPEGRYSTACELYDQLKTCLASNRRRAWRPPLRLAVLVLVLGAVGAISGALATQYLRHLRSLMSQPIIRASVRLEAGHWLDGQRRSPPFGFDQPTRTAIALSGDGRFIVYAAIKENPGTQDRSQLYLRRLDQLEAKPITGTEGGISPILSPDNRWVGFWADGKLMKVSLDGGISSTLCDVAMPFGFSWGTDNRIVFAPGVASGLSRVSAEGGIPDTLTKPDASQDEYSHRLPYCLPGGKGILFTIMKMYSDMHPRVAVLEPGVGKWRILIEDGADARYVPTGHLAFMRQGTLMAIPFDPDRLETTGQAVPVLAGINQTLNVDNISSNTGASQFGISASGSLLYAPGGIFPDRENSLVWVDHKGNAEPITSFKAPFSAPQLSPDGERIAYLTPGRERHVWIYDLNRSTRTRLTSEGSAGWLNWVPDGRRVLLGWGKTGVANIFSQAVDGSSPMERLTQSDYSQYPCSCSPDGQTLAFVEYSPSTGPDVMLLNLSDRKVTPLLNSKFDEHHPEFSPDGRSIAYVSNESGRNEVYVRLLPGPGSKSQISDEGGSEPLWARNGKQLFYRQAWQVWVVNVQSGPALTFTKSRALFEARGYLTGTWTHSWDISPDGGRFLMVKMEDRKSQPVTGLILVQNWFEELKRLVPTK